MPGDPAVLEDTTLALTTTDLLNAVAVKLPPFWPDSIETWLVQAESQYCLKGVTSSQTKFDHLVQAMTQSDAVKVLDLIHAPPADDPYGHLKDRFPLNPDVEDAGPPPHLHSACFFLRGVCRTGRQGKGVLLPTTSFPSQEQGDLPFWACSARF